MYGIRSPDSIEYYPGHYVSPVLNGDVGVWFSKLPFFSLQVLRLNTTLWIMKDLKFLYVHPLAWLFAPYLSLPACSRCRDR